MTYRENFLAYENEKMKYAKKVHSQKVTAKTIVNHFGI